MKNKYVWMYSSFVVLGFSFLMLFFNPTVLILHSKYPVKVSTKEQIELRKWIFNFKNSVNEELLEKCHISVDSRLQPVADFQFNELSKAVNACHIGGVSHPENFGYIILKGVYENMAFNIEIKFARVSGIKTAYLTINALDENGDEIYGIPFISKELTDWAWKVNVFK
ncbi:MAG: hypothetical protein II085_03045 [Alphaproteobacteria bacterium]|nr:hypothetical protein [Alphaproteobacteria bacterium]